MEKRRSNKLMEDMSKQQEEEEATAAEGVSPLSEVLWKEKAVSNSAAARVAWRELTVRVPPPARAGEAVKLLDGLSGYADAGTITVVMGPSGSGKSTLLDALSGRLAVNAFLSGAVFLNGRKLARLPFGAVAYVTQDDDNLIGTLTVRETIMYSARLRLRDKMPAGERRALVESTIVEMGLQDCAHAPIGNWHSRGISGGEKRRVSIALEILTRPRLLFLDEPTSGLDSASAFYVTQTLRSLSRDGRTVVASIHQPSSEVYQLFDRLYLLSGGKTVFSGEASQAHEFFAQAGFPCPSRRNPSDHFLRCINSDFDKVKSALKGSTKGRVRSQSDDPLDNMTTTEVTRKLIEFYNHSQYYYATRSSADEISRLKGSVMDFGGSQASFLVQASTLTKRSFVNMTRDIGYYWLRLATYIVVSVCIGTIFVNVGTKFSSIRARSSCAYFIMTFLTFMSIGGFPSFTEDLKVFHKERLNGYYGVSAFVVGNTLSSAPFLMLIAFISGTISYFLIGLHPGFSHYLFFNLCLCASVYVVESMMMAIASVLPNFLMGVMIGAGIQGIFLMVSGFFRRIDDIPKLVWRYPMTYISFHYWDMQGAYLNDMRGLTFDNSNPDLPKIPGEYVLENTFMVDLHRSKWWDLTVLLAMVVAYRTLFFVTIKLSEDVAPWIRGYIARKRFTRASTVL